MTETIAAKIADGEDLLRPSNWRGHNLEPYTAAKVLRVKSYDPSEFMCTDCDTCLDDPPTPVCINDNYVVQCTPGKVRKVAPAEIAVYEIDVRALVQLVADELGCVTLGEVDGLASAWTLGQSCETFARHTRKVWFFRRFDAAAAKNLASLPNAGKGAIVIAAALGAGLDEKTAQYAFCLAELMRIGDDGVLEIDLDPIRLRFEDITEQERRARQAERKPSKTMLKRVAGLADYLKTVMVSLARELNREGGGYDKVTMEMKKIDQKSIAEHLKLSTSALSRYLDDTWSPELKEAKAARLWFKICTDMALLCDLADTVKNHWPHNTAIVDKLSGVELYDEICRLIEDRRSSRGSAKNL